MKAHCDKIEAFYRIFREISKAIHSSNELDEVLNLIVLRATEIFDGKGAILRILNLETGELELSASYGLSEEYLAKGPVTQKEPLLEFFLQNNIAIIADDIGSNSLIQYPKELLREGVRMVVLAPLKLGEQIAGILRIFFSSRRSFSDEEADFLTAMAEQSAYGIQKAVIIKEQKSRYDELALHTEKLSALGRMSAAIAHEINNPLTGILLYSSNLHKKAGENTRLKEGLEVIIQEARRCKAIIQGLLEFARDKEPTKTPVNVNHIIEKALGILENEFSLHFISIKKDLSRDLGELFLDENKIQQVFINLLINAIQSIGDHGEITVKSRFGPSNGHVTIEIIDTGCGIPEQNLDKIFEPFFSTKRDGSGLGLAVSYGIIKSHRGTLTVHSQPGKGARFVVVLPKTTEAD